ncbi:hypothetical protein [Lysinibacter cavernae]|uniref:Uncharacterized protein n=1 Tax=Lysinibacter cavernae TaxID=1640652 RepID=A0A7X5TS03_9MICO|nr:hypothetical protein [Lysinibacter cavernae]NIH52881.1 hypothetical protein [Lysinibacter cavernae]
MKILSQQRHRNHIQRPRLTSRGRLLLALTVVAGVGALTLPTLGSSSAAYVDEAKASPNLIGMPAAFSLEVKSNNNGDIWSPATTEATAAIVNAITDTTVPPGSVSKPLLMSSSVRVSPTSTVSGTITPTIKPASDCIGTCASIYDFIQLSAWWGTPAAPLTSPIATDVTVPAFNALTSRSVTATPGTEQLLTIKITLRRPPLAIYNGVATNVGVVYNGITDSSLG